MAFFHKGGEASPRWGGPGWQNHSAVLHLPCKSIGNNQPPISLAGWGRGAGVLETDSPCFDPKTNAELATAGWEGWAAPYPSGKRFWLQHSLGGVRMDLAVGTMAPQQPPISPSAPQYPAGGTHTFFPPVQKQNHHTHQVVGAIHKNWRCPGPPNLRRLPGGLGTQSWEG